MLVATLDLRYAAFCPTPENFENLDDYNEIIEGTVEMLADSIYMEKRMELNGFDLSIMDDTF